MRRISERQFFQKKFRRGNSDTGKYCAGTWSVHYTYKRSLSDSGKRWTSGTGANKRAVVLGVNEKTIREHFQVRAALESEACVLCCENKIDFQRIDQILKVSREEIEKVILKVIQVSIRLCTWNYGQQQEMINLKICCQNCGTDCPEAYW